MSSSLDVESLHAPMTGESEESRGSFSQESEVGEPAQEDVSGTRLLGRSNSIRYINERIARVASTPLPVLIEGESGTGKEQLARALHAASSQSTATLRVVRCKGTSDAALAADLLGDSHAPVHAAHLPEGGTLVLDEVGEASLDAQARLLRVLEDLEVGRVPGRPAIRVVATTRLDLERAVGEGRFRADLYHHLHVVPFRLLPLRQRTEDIAPLAAYFARREGLRLRGREIRLLKSAVLALEAHRWPGNIRELENVIRAAVLNVTGSSLGMSEIKPFLTAPITGVGRWEEPFVETVREALGSGSAYRRLLESAERLILKEALAKGVGNKVRAAALLGIHRNSLSRRLIELGVPR